MTGVVNFLSYVPDIFASEAENDRLLRVETGFNP